MSTKKLRSFRWQSGAEYDVDAFFLEDGDWSLFCYLKSEKIEWDALARELVSKFERGKVRLISGALKSKEHSKPLQAMMIQESEKVPDHIWCHDQGMQFRLETQKVLNPGLFLDQEMNRVKLNELIRERQGPKPKPGSLKLLNLFSYTGAFSVVASCLGVITTSVDVSAHYLDWEKRNHAQNAEEKKREWGDMYPSLRLLREDAREFVRRSIQKKEKYSFIILDPPTFSRGEGAVFKAKQDLGALVGQCFKLLDKQGSMLVSSNDASWTEQDFYGAIEGITQQIGYTAVRGELPEEFKKITPRYPLKSIWISR